MYTVSVAVLQNEEVESSFVAKLRQELSDHTGYQYYCIHGSVCSKTVSLAPVRSDGVEMSVSYLVQPLPLGNVVLT